MYNEKKNLSYLSVMNGEVVRRVDDKFPDAVSRINKKGDTVYEKRYPSITATITDILVETNDYGKQWAIFLRGDDNGVQQEAKLTLMYNSKPATCFLCCIENVDVTRPITFTPKENTNDEGVKSTSLFLNQDGKAAKWAHTKKEPNGMPPGKEVIVNGKPTWDSTDKLAFFEKLIAEKILSKIKTVVNKEDVVVEEHPSDDLPF